HIPDSQRMANANHNGSIATPATRVLVRVALYYIIVVALGMLAWRFLPLPRFIADDSLSALFGSVTDVGRRPGKNAVVGAPVDQGTLAATVGLAMLAAALVALPVAWIYTLTRSKRGY